MIINECESFICIRFAARSYKIISKAAEGNLIETEPIKADKCRGRFMCTGHFQRQKSTALEIDFSLGSGGTFQIFLGTKHLLDKRETSPMKLSHS